VRHQLRDFLKRHIRQEKLADAVAWSARRNPTSAKAWVDPG
jgi:hypothetical protein